MSYLAKFFISFDAVLNRIGTVRVDSDKFILADIAITWRNVDCTNVLTE